MLKLYHLHANNQVASSQLPHLWQCQQGGKEGNTGLAQSSELGGTVIAALWPMQWDRVLGQPPSSAPVAAAWSRSGICRYAQGNGTSVQNSFSLLNAQGVTKFLAHKGLHSYSQNHHIFGWVALDLRDCFGNLVRGDTRLSLGPQWSNLVALWHRSPRETPDCSCVLVVFTSLYFSLSVFQGVTLIRTQEQSMALGRSWLPFSS